MMKARKKKKKKLKSRRERDKHKALLKLTHHTPTKPTPQPPPSQIAPSTNPTVLSYNEFNKKLTNLDSQLYRFNQTEATPRNGGIPIFIKERIEERVKRRSDAESAADRFSDEVMQLYCHSTLCTYTIIEMLRIIATINLAILFQNRSIALWTNVSTILAD